MSDINRESAIEEELIQSKKTFTCINCNKNFVYKNVVGQLECSYHPKSVYLRDGTYLCCGENQGIEGCTKCDHTWKFGGGEKFRLVPTYMYMEKIYKTPNIDIETKDSIRKSGVEYVKIKTGY